MVYLLVCHEHFDGHPQVDNTIYFQSVVDSDVPAIVQVRALECP